MAQILGGGLEPLGPHEVGATASCAVQITARTHTISCISWQLHASVIYSPVQCTDTSQLPTDRACYQLLVPWKI